MNRALPRTIFAVATASLIAAGCGTAATDASHSTAATDASVAATTTVAYHSTTATHGSPSTCSTSPGTSWVDVRFRGQSYPVRVHVPDGVARKRPAPLVLNLHFSNGNADMISSYNDLDATADENGFITVAPNGDIPAADPNPDQIWLWNVPGVPTTGGDYPPPGARDDVAFLTQVIDTFVKRGCADADRVYITGHSGGARMASAYACERPEKVAAIAPVAGLRAGRPSPDAPHALELQSCAPRKTVPVITFHGDADTTNPYEGNADKRWGYTTQLAMQTWARFDGCTRGPAVSQVSEHVTKEAYSKCKDRSEVVFYKVAGGTHSWPGSPEDDTATQEVDATEIIWDFFAKHRN